MDNKMINIETSKMPIIMDNKKMNNKRSNKVNKVNKELAVQGLEQDNKKGKVWLVGAGPSDIGLLTLKAFALLQEADVVVFDKLVGVEILNHIPRGAKLIDVGKRSNDHPVPQEEINQILLQEALSGAKVVRLKGGDPFLFGRGGEEIELLQEHGVPFEIVPGISSALSVPTYAGIPVTHRDFSSAVHIITGHQKDGEALKINFEALTQINGTLVFLMGVAALSKICDGLLRAGLDPETPAAVIESGTTARQRKLISTVQGLTEDALKAKIKAPAIIIVGEVCKLGETFAWAERRPLHGLRVIVTRPEKLCSTLGEQIRSQGGEAISFPCIHTFPLYESEPFNEALSSLRNYQWLVFTSVMGVETFLEKLKMEQRDIRELFGIKIAVIGSGTAQAFEQRGIRIDYQPESYNAKALGEGLAAIVEKNEKVLILRAKEASEELTLALGRSRIDYLDIAVYKTVIKTPKCNEEKSFSYRLIEEGDFDYAAFTSASTVKGFVTALPHLDYTKIKALCIGEQTAAEAQRYGMKVFVSTQATISSMVEKLIEIRLK